MRLPTVKISRELCRPDDSGDALETILVVDVAGIAVPFVLFTLLYLLLGGVVVATMRRTVRDTDPRAVDHG